MPVANGSRQAWLSLVRDPLESFFSKMSVLEHVTDRVTHQTSHLICFFTATGFPFEGPPAVFSLITTPQSGRLSGVGFIESVSELICYLLREVSGSNRDVVILENLHGHVPRVIASLTVVLYGGRHGKDCVLHMLCQQPALPYTRLSKVPDALSFRTSMNEPQSRLIPKSCTLTRGTCLQLIRSLDSPQSSPPTNGGTAHLDVCSNSPFPPAPYSPNLLVRVQLDAHVSRTKSQIGGSEPQLRRTTSSNERLDGHTSGMCC
ncbi:Uncharacterized protein HZ326_23572 [Fusarium oxysporum f. sp. albedinis]|nr:Uncharacterized protein HZ326_23572 [Fusarium oxysporum f. sp. albedinis]